MPRNRTVSSHNGNAAYGVAQTPRFEHVEYEVKMPEVTTVALDLYGSVMFSLVKGFEITGRIVGSDKIIYLDANQLRELRKALNKLAGDDDEPKATKRGT